MGSVVSAIGTIITTIITATADILIFIVNAIVTILVTIWDLFVDILCCRCCSSRRRVGTRRTFRRSNRY